MVNMRADSAGLPTHEVVYRRLRDMILFGELAPGQPVTIQGLVERLEVGMTPVREALRRLIAEGALVFQGNRRITVPVLDAAAVEELTLARVALEPQLARRAAQRCSADGVARLRATDARLDAAIGKGDVTGYLVENHQFHTELNEIAGAPILTDLVEGLWLRFGPSLRVVCGQFGTRNLPDLHKAILDALEARDAEAAAEAMEQDVRQGMEQIAAALEG
ncbi:GntR family transcriptional regulator [Salipiger bermudensis]|uniref:Transcriptional regulator, GntR family protein n=1 Tax=Salipiger bermudensis (strain DSM 26914 / JCM 13377 / KCTC 12554 / HTCC2601) TaxID=314265 RepID=Q0FRQ9_SALBH|nr:GntR family transcriptional regulator [Salipiger bermudensis]EAU46795.1 transcriptional regulator, GntR family protein [Salipiger bermudensis HTCC2601]